MPYLGIFELEFLKNYCHIWNERPRICLTANFHKKIQMSKFGTKNASFGHFWVRIWKNYRHVWNQHARICLITKFPPPQKKCFYLAAKMLYLGTFGLELEKSILISEISTLEFLKNESLTHTVSFGIGFAFSKGPGPGSSNINEVIKTI